MTPRVWVERPILSVEDAEALPEGTVAIQSWGHGTTARTLTNGRWITPSGSALPNAEAIGFTALVPVEVVEERRRESSVEPGITDPEGMAVRVGPVQRRYVTEWEPS